MSTPRRIQLSRGRGSRFPAGARSVSRPTRFGNPYKVQPHGPWTLAEFLALFERDLLAGRLVSAPGRGHTTLEEVRQLAGHDLACYSPPGQPCHADLLIRLANPPSALRRKTP